MMNNIVGQAILATLNMGSEGQGWLEGIYKKISSEGGTGSYLPMNPEEVAEIIRNASWEVETVKGGDRPSAIAVTKGINGFYNMRSLEELDDSEMLAVEKYHGDKPQLGWVSDEFLGTPTDELRAICGTDQDGNGTFLITVYPGPVVNPEDIEVSEEYLGKVITVAEAKRLGAKFCKVVTTKAVEEAKERR